ncbi:DUF1285 domain-containing protein [Thalassotalea maritima]|uniref:DUF1285 domain-containing protein n=1 Tax=Thalassotalea maritima TaxID=3242416 RepID=UPI0035285F52
MSLQRISEQIHAKQNELPPVEKWDPPFCGNIDMVITADGKWLYQGSEITRPRLVKLFARVLIKQGNKYYLVTPVEKIGISVERYPFTITSWQWLDDSEQATMLLTTNLGDQILLNDKTPLILDDNGQPIIKVRRNLYASIHRNVFYQWAEIAQEKLSGNKEQLYIKSAGVEHVIGEL